MYVPHTACVSYYHGVISEKNEYDFNACNNVRDIQYNTDAITSIVKLIVRSPVGSKLVLIYRFFLLFGVNRHKIKR